MYSQQEKRPLFFALCDINERIEHGTPLIWAHAGDNNDSDDNNNEKMVHN